MRLYAHMTATPEHFESLLLRVRSVIDTRDQKTLSRAFPDWPDLDEFTRDARHYGKFPHWNANLQSEAISTMEAFLSRF